MTDSILASPKRALLAVISLLLAMTVSADVCRSQSGPIPPRWVYEPWVWEDNDNTRSSTLALVEGYRARQIPVGAVIVDSPWETYYNSFEFCSGSGQGTYPDPAGMIDDLHAMGVRVILWTTGVVNAPGTDKDGCNDDPRPNFCNDETAQYFVDPRCNVRTHWWKNPSGVDGAKFVDFRNPDAAAWWVNGYVRPILELGIDGLKVDETDRHVDEVIDDQDERRAYRDAYYRTMYQAVRDVVGDQGIITARPFDRTNEDDWGGAYDGISAPIDANPAGWVGDQIKTWGDQGILEALYNVLESSERGYVACGSDIGGFLTDRTIPSDLFVRWAQFGALCPIMDNGGRGEHRPWAFSGDVEEIFRRYAKLHHFLVPYLNHYGIEFADTGTSIIRPQPGWKGASGSAYTYLLGESLFVAPIYEDDDTRTIDFPDGEWLDFFDDRVAYSGTEELTFARRDYPLFIRSGAIVFLEVDQDDDDAGYELELGSAASATHRTVLYYPDGQSSIDFHVDRDESILVSAADLGNLLDVGITASGTDRFLFRIKYERPAASVSLNDRDLPEHGSRSELESADDGWYLQTDRGWLWVKFDTRAGLNSLVVAEQPDSVELSWFNARPTDAGVLLQWRTGASAEVVEFDVYRARLAGPGQRQRLNTSPIPALTTVRDYEFLDTTITVTSDYEYTIDALERSGERRTIGRTDVAAQPPSHGIALLQSHPNPTDFATDPVRIPYVVDAPSRATVTVHDSRGRLVRTVLDSTVEAGAHVAVWDGVDEAGDEVGAGVYFYRLTVGNRVISRKLVHLR